MIAFILDDESNGVQEAFLKLADAKEEAKTCVASYNIMRIELPVSVESILLLLSTGGGYATSYDVVLRHEGDSLPGEPGMKC